MLMNCPRCGFSQPKDQYCAQCGVDMYSFKPQKKPIMNQIFGNAGVQIALLLITAVLVGQYIFHSQEPQNWVQKITHFQGTNKSVKSKNSTKPAAEQTSMDEADATNESAETSQAETLGKREKGAGRSTELANTASGGIQNATAAQASQSGAQDLSSVNFKITYVEIATEMLTKWINESSNLGLYQNLEQYSAGIISDFKKHGDNFQQKLKTSDIKLNLGGSNSSLSGLMSDDGNQILGLITAIEYKSNENGIIHGNISITRSSAQSSEFYPAEFALSKGAAFFIIGALKRGGSAADRAERAKLSMPPFQIFKSPDFMTRKTEFVIIIEPDYK